MNAIAVPPAIGQTSRPTTEVFDNSDVGQLQRARPPLLVATAVTQMALHHRGNFELESNLDLCI